MFSSSQLGLVSYFANASRHSELRQCYIISGDEGLGKSHVLEHILKLILCRTRDACGSCPDCQSIASFAHPDCVRISNGDKKIIELAKIRSMINEVYIRPSAGGRKVFVIENANLMEAPAQNAVLKVIEEPPSYAIFILVTDKLDAMLPTILSRSMALKLGVWTKDEQKAVFPLREDEEYMYAYSLGNIGRLKKIAVDYSFQNIRNGVIDSFVELATGDEAKVYEAIDFWTANKDSKSSLLDTLTMFIRDIMLFKSGAVSEIANTDKIKQIQAVSQRISFDKCFNMLEIASDAPRLMGKYGNFNMLTQTLMIRLGEEIHD